MVDKALRQHLDLVCARILAVRNVVARLLAYEAARWPDPNTVFEGFSTTTDAHIHQLTKPGQVDDSELRFQEEIRMQVDWIIANARLMMLRTK